MYANRVKLGYKQTHRRDAKGLLLNGACVLHSVLLSSAGSGQQGPIVVIVVWDLFGLCKSVVSG
jgi:hypothetical protein